MARIVDSFIYVLPSNVPCRNGKNTLSKYVTDLPSTIHLDKSWRVGLASISYTKSWFNVHQDEEIYIVDDTGNSFMCRQSLGKGMYESEKDFVSAINDVISTAELSDMPPPAYSTRSVVMQKAKENIHTFVKKPELVLNRFTHRATLVAGERSDGATLYASFSQTLNDILGLARIMDQYDSEFMDNNVTSVYSKLINASAGAFRSYDLKAGIHNLLVYTDIIAPQLVGNTYSNLLRSASIPSKVPFGEQADTPFPKPFYFPLKHQQIQRITIDLRDDSGKLIPFEWGRTTITLEFVKYG